MKKTKFYSVLVTFVIAMFAAISMAVAFALPSKNVAKADESVKVYDYEVITGPEDTSRNPAHVYFGVSMPESIKPGDTFDVGISFLNRSAGICGITLNLEFSNGFAINKNKQSTYIPASAMSIFSEDEGTDCNVSNDGLKVSAMYSTAYDEGIDDNVLTTQSFIELLMISVTADTVLAPTADNNHYYVKINWNSVSANGVVIEGGDVLEDFTEIHYTSLGGDGYEIVVEGNESKDVTMATGYPKVSASGVLLSGELGTESQSWDEANPTLSVGAPGIGGLRYTTYQSYDVTSKLSYSTESLTVEANANDSAAVVKMLTNPDGDGSDGNEKYTVVNNNTYTFDISGLTPNVTNAEAVETEDADPVYETDASGAYYKYTLPYVYEVFAEANGYVRIYSVTFYKEIEEPEDLPLTLNSVRLVSKNSAISYNSTYEVATKTYTIVDANDEVLTIPYADAKQDAWKYWSIVAERTYTGSEVTTTGDGVVTLKAGANQFELVISDGENSETYFVEVNVAQPNTDKSLSSVIIKNKDKPSDHYEIADKLNTNTNVYTADPLAAENVGKTWRVDATATQDGLVEITYPVQEKLLVAGVNNLRITVTDQLGASVTYTVTITVIANDDTDLDVFKAGDTDLVAGADGKYSYKISDTVDHFYIFADAKEATTNIEVRNDGTLVQRLDEKYLIDVKLSDTVTKQEITVTVTSEADTVVNYVVVVTRLSSDVTLKSVYIENAAGKTYDAVINNTAHTVTISGLTYQESLDATAWTMHVEANSEGAEYVKSKALTSFANNTIVVTPETGATDAVTYTVTITALAGDSNTNLNTVYISNGTDSLLAEIDNAAKTCVISGMTYAQSFDTWTMYVTAESALATYTHTVQLTSLDGNTIVVVPETGEANKATYTVTINRIAGDENAALKTVYISNGTDSLIAVIDNAAKTCVISGMTYAQSLETWTMYVETESALAHTTASVELTSLDGNKITVTPEKGAAVDYTVTINRLAPNTDTTVVIGAKAGSQDLELKINGNTYSAVVNYDEISTVTVSVTTSDLATVKIDNVAARSKAVTLSVGDNVVAIEVTAEDGTVSTYSVIISAYTETASGDTDTFIEISGGANGNLTQSEFLSNGYIVKEVKVANGVSTFKFTIKVPEYIKVTVAFGNATLSGGAQTAAVERANGSTVEYTVQVKSLKEGNNAVGLELTDTRTGETKILVENVFKAYKSNGGLVAAIVIFAILFVAVAVLFVLNVLGILDFKKLFSKKGKKGDKAE